MIIMPKCANVNVSSEIRNIFSRKDGPIPGRCPEKTKKRVATQSLLGLTVEPSSMFCCCGTCIQNCLHQPCHLFVEEITVILDVISKEGGRSPNC